jgi:RecB family exonuclease
VRRRPLGAAGWEHDPPTEREAALAAAAGGPRVRSEPIAPLAPETVAALRPGDRPWNPTEIEAWASCPVKWFVDKVLHPEDLAPDPEALVRGRVAHDVLREVFSALEGRPLEPSDLPAARERMHGALAREVEQTPISVNRERLQGEVRRLEADLVRYLEHAAADGSDFAPTLFEAPFDDVDLGPLRLRGRIDRIDLRDGEAVIVDYKGKTATAVARWIQDGKLQLGLYILAARKLAEAGELPGTPVGGLYQPLGNEDPRPRGMLLDGADPGRVTFKTDRVGAEEFEVRLEEVLAAAEEAVRQLRAGGLEPRPESCMWDGSGCSHPTICRCDAA